MMGNKTLRETREDIRKAFAKIGRDVVQWLEEEMRRVDQVPKHDLLIIDELERLRDALATDAKKSGPQRRRTRAKSKSKRAHTVR